MKTRARTYSGTTSDSVSQREKENRLVARRAAADGMVLLKNEGVLPLAEGETVALFGGGAVKTIKGGIGSGDVNARDVVGIYQGFLDAGIRLSNQQWLEAFSAIYQKAREDWRNDIWEKSAKTGMNVVDTYLVNPFRMPTGGDMQASDFAGAKTGFYVISRTAGENADRVREAGDYFLTDTEKEQLTSLSRYVENVAVIVNAGGQIDLSFVESIPNLKVLMIISQPGMEGGHALADVVTGKVIPSGKLVDTWAKDYLDFPNAATFSYLNGDVDNERYYEGQYVGYRYFDSFQKAVAYPFGFGLSYTSFDIRMEQLRVEGNKAEAKIIVTNTGDTYAGREVVQLYASCPQTDIPKVYRKLVAFGKTALLQPGEKETHTLRFDAKDLASFDESASAWVVEGGKYGIWAGNSSRDLTLSGVLEVEKTVVIEETTPICPIPEQLEELECPAAVRLSMEKAWKKEAEEKKLPTISFAPGLHPAKRIAPNDAAVRAAALTEKLTREQLISMTTGAFSGGLGSQIGAAGVRIPGSAGETSHCLEEQYAVPGISMADGPAGIRLVKSYEVDIATGKVPEMNTMNALEGGFFADNSDRENTLRYYQYTTAIPVGTALAQTWDEDLLADVGKAVAREMEEFGIAWWLAPGMNIHRNPLCGRNFEYYSEDPLVSGKLAAAVTKGVQSVPGVGTTIKHFACNNQEDNRRGSSSVLTERTLREIYLRGFEIAVKESQPMAIMTSYNLLNGVHTANSADLCTVAAREEWDFQGIIMSDWGTTHPGGGSESWRCIAAGNDLIMPGREADAESIRNALAQGSLDIADLKACVRRMLTVIFQTLGYENPVPYGAQF